MSAATAPAASGAPATNGGWFLLKFTNGAVGLQRIAPGAPVPANTIRQQFIGSHTLSLVQLASDSMALQNSLGHIGASAKQQASLITQLDVGAGKNSATNWIYVAPDIAGNKVTSNTSPKPTGDANPINQIPSPIPPSAGNSHLGFGDLGGIAVRVLEAVGGVLLLVLGIRALMGGESPAVTIGRAASSARLGL